MELRYRNSGFTWEFILKDCVPFVALADQTPSEGHVLLNLRHHCETEDTDDKPKTLPCFKGSHFENKARTSPSAASTTPAASKPKKQNRELMYGTTRQQAIEQLEAEINVLCMATNLRCHGSFQDGGNHGSQHWSSPCRIRHAFCKGTKEADCMTSWALSVVNHAEDTLYTHCPLESSSAIRADHREDHSRAEDGPIEMLAHRSTASCNIRAPGFIREFILKDYMVKPLWTELRNDHLGEDQSKERGKGIGDIQNRILSGESVLGVPRASLRKEVSTISKRRYPAAALQPNTQQLTCSVSFEKDDDELDNAAPIESTPLKSVSYYIWMRASVELLRALLAFAL
ncbi:hypothetical protein CNMCM6106_007977 [Aspergillus hiratsukae]|uniref:Uncharacterized protein n=1 Tax=Aspergillus hiratsukae TaxID=1194566 RepID=A0A8H6PUI1_9EURO|nr:hypothetical protein CNMCM6106_007977 [Aspergillus hiratsukae]